MEYEINDEGSLQELDAKNKRQIPAISIVHVEGDLLFGAADLFLTQIQRTIADDNLKCIILRLKNARHLDATSVLALDELIKDTRKKGVLQTLQEGCIREEGETNLFMYFRSNPNISTRDALIRAQQLIGTKDADIKIFFDTNKEK